MPQKQGGRGVGQNVSRSTLRDVPFFVVLKNFPSDIASAATGSARCCF